MRVLLIGNTGIIGSAVQSALETNHEVIGASRSGVNRVDLLDEQSIRELFARLGPVDAVVVTTGSVPFKPLEELSHLDFVDGYLDKALGQINVVRIGSQVLDGPVSFTLTSGILSRDPIRTGAVASTVNAALDAFAKAAAGELPAGQRVNVVSPTVIAEAEGYHSSFPGFIPATAARVAQAYVRAVTGIDNGRTFIVD